LPKPPPPAPARQAVLGLSLKSVTLGNGLRVVVVDDPHATEVQVTMRYRIGAGDDLENPGMAHLVEHLMFQQTLGAQTLFAQLEDNATFFNAFTLYDSTTYVSRARPELLDKLLAIEAVRLGFRCTSITDSAFEREREVVKQEVRLSDDSTEIITAVHSAVYPAGHPYRQAIGGSVDSVGAITRQQACAFADSYYATNNAVLVISGHLSTDAVQTSLGKFLARIAKRTAASPAPVAEPRKWDHVASVPLDMEALLVTWRMPTDPYAQIGVRAIAHATENAIDGEIKGGIAYLELGDERAPVFGYVLVPAKNETIQDVLGKVQDTLKMLPEQFESRWMPSQVFDALRQRAIYQQYAALEDGPSRDERLAMHVLAGRDPAAALADEFRALRNLARAEAASVSRKYLAFEDASVVRLTPAAGKKRGHKIEVKQAVHDMGQRRSVPDVALAHQPDTTLVVPALSIKTRVLPNGLKVVMLPVSTVPTVDVRLVFGAGSADEPRAQAGTAMLAANALTFDLRYINDVLSFAIAGGSIEPEVTSDRTSFTVRGVDMHIDYLLVGLKRMTVDGRYSEWADKVVEAAQRERKRSDDNSAVTDAWRGALYGANHPYARSGCTCRVSRTISVEDAELFRAAYYTPDNATLVISGHFDEALTNQWIDYLFADWSGRAQSRQSFTPELKVATLAKPEELSQVQLSIALPSRGTRAQLLVAAAMLSEIARDVRHQLGAAYGFDASLDENRLATNLVIAGWFDPARADEVVRLLGDRIGLLRTDSNAAALAFITARRRVVISLASLTGSASRLAARAETDIELGRAPLSDLQTAKQVQALTIDDMAPILEQLDLSRGAMLMRGPADPINAAFAVLGRQPTVVKFDQAAADALDDDPPRPTPQRSHEQRIEFDDIEEAITARQVSELSPLEIVASANLATARLSDLTPPMQSVPVDDDAVGVSFVGEVGYRFSRRGSVGLHLGLGTFSSSYSRVALGVEIARYPYSFVPLDAGLFLHMRPLDRAWGGFLVGAHRDFVQFEAEDRRPTTGWTIGVEGGYDVLVFGTHRIGAVVRVIASYGADVGYSSLSAGLAYRH
jgi:zinc protease